LDKYGQFICRRIKVVIGNLGCNHFSNEDVQPGLLSSDRDQLIDMLAFSGHELNNMLTRVLMSIESLVREGDASLTDRQKRAVQCLYDNAHLLRKMAHTYMDMARIEDPSFVPDAELLEPAAEVIEPLLKGYGDVLLNEQRGCHLQVLTSGDQVMADRTMLISVFDNLLNNAIKYGLPGSDIGISVIRRESDLEISFQNTVQSLDPGMLEHAFDRFTRGTNTQNKSGTGIGLYLTRQIVDRLGGSIRIETSEAKNQVSFIVRLPCAS
jgi:signal transduction histidine kinase